MEALTYWNQWAIINGMLHEEQQPAFQTATTTNIVQWNPPMFGFLKCNVDYREQSAHVL
jgi:hypothetical protein